MNTPSAHDNTISENNYNWEEPSRLSKASGGYSLLLGNEEEELQAMLRELLAAFPTQTKKSKCIICLVVLCLRHGYIMHGFTILSTAQCCGQISSYALTYTNYQLHPLDSHSN